MIYWLANYLTPYWGPFRLLQSHALLLAGGTFTAALLVWLLLPRLWRFLPHDHGKAILKDMGGMKSAGKPTGGGLVVTLVAFPVIVLFVPRAVKLIGLKFGRVYDWKLCMLVVALFWYIWGEVCVRIKRKIDIE